MSQRPKDIGRKL